MNTILISIIAIIALATLWFTYGNVEYFDQMQDDYKTHDNVNLSLNKSLVSKNEHIANLEPSKTTGLEDADQVDIANSTDADQHTKLGSNQVTHIDVNQMEHVCLPKSHPIYARIKDRQQAMFNEPTTKKYYDKPYYYDWRYPEKPLDIEFAANPKKYCKKYPHRYPCYITTSRHDLKGN